MNSKYTAKCLELLNTPGIRRVAVQPLLSASFLGKFSGPGWAWEDIQKQVKNLRLDAKSVAVLRQGVEAFFGKSIP